MAGYCAGAKREDTSFVIVLYWGDVRKYAPNIKLQHDALVYAYWYSRTDVMRWNLTYSNGLTNTWGVNNHRDRELLQMGSRTNAREKKQLRGVEGTTTDDYFFRGVCFSGYSIVGSIVTRIGAVEALALQVLDTNSPRLLAILIEDDFSGEGV